MLRLTLKIAAVARRTRKTAMGRDEAVVKPLLSRNDVRVDTKEHPLSLPR
jgi:hypothetical protein